jgi:hypothetical protein
VTLRGSVRGIAALCLIGASAVFAAQPAQAAQAARLLPRGAGTAATSCSPALKGISLSPASLPGAARSTVTATLTCAPSKAVSVSLKGFTGAKAPSTVKVAAGKTSATGTITTSTRTKALRGWITGVVGKVSKRSLLAIGVTPKTCKTTALSSVSLVSLAYVGDKPALGLKLTCTPAAAVKLTLKSTVTGQQAPALAVPATVTINAYYNSASVALTPKVDKAGQYAATVSVHYGSKTLTKKITIDPGLLLFQNSPAGGAPDSVDPDILFTGPLPAAGLTVKLMSSNAAITLPATASFAGPGAGGDFLGVKVADVTKDTTVTLSATLGSKTLTTSVTLLPPWNSGDKITLATNYGNTVVYGPAYGYEIYVNLSDPADPDGNGLTATATSSSPTDVELEGGTVGFSPGSDQGIISFEIPNETAPVHATVSVSLDGVTASIPVTIEPSLASVTVPATIVGGQSGTGTVTLAGAPDVAETVDLQSSWGILTLSGSGIVTIPAGQTSATFSFTTVPVDSDSSVGIGAALSVGSMTVDGGVGGTVDVTSAS